MLKKSENFNENCSEKKKLNAYYSTLLGLQGLGNGENGT